MNAKFIIAAAALALVSAAASAQQAPDYEFTTVKENPITSVKNQNRSGTCWCFSALSFIESEILRTKGIETDLSEMFVVGKSYRERAVELSEQASNEFDDKKYNALVEQFEKALLDALEPFEKAYNVTKDNTLKVSIAEYLKNIYYRNISKGAEYEAAYNKYNEVVKTGQPS